MLRSPAAIPAGTTELGLTARNDTDGDGITYRLLIDGQAAGSCIRRTPSARSSLVRSRYWPGPWQSRGSLWRAYCFTGELHRVSVRLYKQGDLDGEMIANAEMARQ